MTASKQKRGFPWKKCCFFLIFLIGAVLLVDYRKHGSFKDMRTNKYLESSGILVHGQKVWSNMKVYTDQSLQSLEKSYPDQYKSFCGLTSSYSKLAVDTWLIMRNASLKLYDNTATYIVKKQPIVVASIEQYVPGLLDTVSDYSKKSLELVKVYSAVAGERVIEHSTTMIRWMETNVFVGKLSPESLQSYASKAIDTTQTYASETYNWVYEKVQTLSKVQ